MAESGLTLSYADLANYVCGEYGLGPDYTDSDLTAEESAIIDRMVQDGYRQAMNPPVLDGDTQQHIWSFLRPIRHITTVAPYNTGTIEIAVGALTTVTLTAGTWPTWAADGQLVIDGRPYRVLSRNVDGIHLTLAENGPVSAAGTTYELQRYFYTMEDDFGGIEGPLTYQAGYASQRIIVTGEGRIRELQQCCTLTGRPRMAAIHWDPALQSATVSVRARIQFEPIPDAVYYLTYRAEVIPVKLDATTYPYPLGGYEMSQVIRDSCLASVEWELQRRRGDRWAGFIMSLKSAIISDRQRAPEIYQPVLHHTDSEGGVWPYSPHLVEYIGNA